MRRVHRFPPRPPVDAQTRWARSRWGPYDLGWPVDEVMLVALPQRWALIGRWFDGEPVVDSLDDVEFDGRDEAIGFALQAGLPVWDNEVLLAMPLPDTPEQATWRRQLRLDHLAERLRAVDALIDDHPGSFQLRALKETLIQRWNHVKGPRPMSRRSAPTP